MIRNLCHIRDPNIQELKQNTPEICQIETMNRRDTNGEGKTIETGRTARIWCYTFVLRLWVRI